MKLKLSVDQSTSPSELIILGALFESLALAREGHVVSVPAEECDGDDPTPAETVVVQVPPAAAGEEPPKRRRRTKAEIEAANLPPEAPAPTEPEQAPATETPAPTQPAPVTDTTPAQAPAEPEPATASHSEPPTPVSLNIKATAVAKKIGPEKIKAKIVELGGKLISTLSPEALIEFDAWLDAQ